MEKIKVSEIFRLFNNKENKNIGGNATGVSIDTRTINKGDVFFALKGENYDANDFTDVALSKGAVAVVSEKSNIKYNKLGIPIITVENTLKALQDFARYYKNKHDTKIIGITGSNGKTTTKDILDSIISQKYSVLSTKGNLNNHIGLPLTLFNLEKSHKYCVLEMGANHQGEITDLCKIAEPSYGVITNIGLSHIGNFSSIQNILNTKMELFRYLKKNNYAIINNDDEKIVSASKKINCKKVTFGIKNNADVMASCITAEQNATFFNISVNGKIRKLKLPVCGTFNVYNALAAAACSSVLNISDKDIVAGIENFKPQKRRMEIVKLKNGIILINDSYNANPTSMKNAIDNFSKIFYNNRKILVLGDMCELGNYSISEHRKLGAYIFENKSADIIYAIGNLSKNIIAISGGHWFKDKIKISEYLIKNLKKGDAVFFKASRKIGLDEVVEKIVHWCDSGIVR